MVLFTNKRWSPSSEVTRDLEALGFNLPKDPQVLAGDADDASEGADAASMDGLGDGEAQHMDGPSPEVVPPEVEVPQPDGDTTDKAKVPPETSQRWPLVELDS